MPIKDRILKFTIVIIVIIILGCLILPFHLYETMTHFDEQELEWYQPFILEDSIIFESNEGESIHALVKGELSNRPTWARFNSDFNLLRPHYVAWIRGYLDFPDSTFLHNHISIVKFEAKGGMNFTMQFANRWIDIDLDKENLSDTLLNGILIPKALFINKYNSKNTYKQHFKLRNHLVDELLWSKPLGLVYFMTADSTKYYRRDVFYATTNMSISKF